MAYYRDITDEWNVVTAIGTFQDVCAESTAPGRNSDPDILVVGRLGQAGVLKYMILT